MFFLIIKEELKYILLCSFFEEKQNGYEKKEIR